MTDSGSDREGASDRLCRTEGLTNLGFVCVTTA